MAECQVDIFFHEDMCEKISFSKFPPCSIFNYVELNLNELENHKWQFAFQWFDSVTA